jgi:uncharacterized Zn finger protein
MKKSQYYRYCGNCGGDRCVIKREMFFHCKNCGYVKYYRTRGRDGKATLKKVDVFKYNNWEQLLKKYKNIL